MKVKYLPETSYLVLGASLLILLVFIFKLNTTGRTVALWDRFETTIINNKTYANPFKDVVLNAVFTSPSGKTYGFFGFYDGDGEGGQTGNVWKLRFMPDELGAWSYTCSFSDGSIGKSGSFKCTVRAAKPGPLCKDPADGRWLKFANGERFYPRGYYASEIFTAKSPHWENLIDTFFGQTYKYNLCCTIFWQGRLLDSKNWNNLPYNGFYPTVDGDYTKLNIAAWQHVDEVLQRLESCGAVWFNFDGFVPNVGGDMGPQLLDFEAQKTYTRNVVARLGPYWNIIWNIAFEWDEPQCFGDNPAAVSRLADYIKTIDPWGHLVAVHDEAYYTTGSEVIADLHTDFPVLQSDAGRSDSAVANSEKMQQFSGDWPVYAQEVCWEGTGKLNADQIRTGGWGVVLGGGILNYAEQFGGPNSGTPQNFGDGRALPYIEIMFDFMESIPYYRMKPHNEFVSDGGICFAAPGELYVIYIPAADDGRATTIKNLDNKNYNARWFNPRTADYTDITASPAALSQWTLPAAPEPAEKDWVCVLTKID